MRLQAIGNVEAYATVAVKSRVDGQIVEVQLPRRPGSEEGRDPVPASIRGRSRRRSSRPRRRPLRDVASRDQARSQERRYQELLEKNFVSKEAYAQYRTNAQTADATAKASQAALENAR